MSNSTTLRAAIPSTDDRAQLRRLVYVLIIAISTAYSAGRIASVRPLLSANDRSRWATVWSLVERGTYKLDEINKERKWQTIDRVTLNGSIYSSKPPLLATIVAGIYWVTKQVTGLNLYDNTEAVNRIILYIVNLIPFAIALVVLAKMLERYAKSDFTRIFVLAAAAFGTFLSTFLVVLNNHSPAAVSVIFAIYPAVRIIGDGERKPWQFIVAGFFAGFAVTNELTAAMFGAALFVMLLRKAPKETLMYFVPAAIIPLAALVGTNYAAVGTWKPNYALYGSEAYTKNPDGSDTVWANPKGIDKGKDTPLVYLFNCTLGHHGIFSLSPIFLLTVLAWLQLRSAQQALRPLLWLGLGLTVANMAFYLTRTENYNYGGMTSGLRWAFWLIPFWTVALIPICDRFCDRRWFRNTAVVLLLISAFSAAYPFANPWQHPWLFRVLEEWKWIDYSQIPAAARAVTSLC